MGSFELCVSQLASSYRGAPVWPEIEAVTLGAKSDNAAQRPK